MHEPANLAYLSRFSSLTCRVLNRIALAVVSEGRGLHAAGSFPHGNVAFYFMIREVHSSVHDSGKSVFSPPHLG